MAQKSRVLARGDHAAGHGRAASKKTEETELTEDRHGVPVPCGTVVPHGTARPCQPGTTVPGQKVTPPRDGG